MSMRYRNIEKLIEAIKKEIPEKWDDREMFIKSLDNVIDSSHYRAPEAYRVNFDQLAMSLGDNLGEPDTDWKMRIADIFSDKIKIDGMTFFED